MNAPIPAHLLPRLEPRPLPAAMIDALKTRFGERCSTALAVREQHPEMRIQLVDVAERLDPQVVLRHPGAVAEAGGSVVTGAGCDLREPMSHAGHASSARSSARRRGASRFPTGSAGSSAAPIA